MIPLDYRNPMHTMAREEVPPEPPPPPPRRRRRITQLERSRRLWIVAMILALTLLWILWLIPDPHPLPPEYVNQGIAVQKMLRMP
jgi:hypothetical protein